ncbi:MAG: hypothetical protein A3F68_03055 [Acidobacteria bacterium RIFCSPLOWO2_12_FULL_54_10]|nr:MAG: hypothetical protein A3F68_03055 [Acidobacteria bacterium RIFCSPLOWO2_12_FULL_54_10]
MRILIISDIHANVEGLQAVLEAAKGEYTQVVCCGDLVGYGPEPNEVADWVRKNAHVVVRGNHDKVAAGIDSANQFNDIAKQAAYWTIEQLSEENKKYLFDLPKGPLEVTSRYGILHGSPLDEDEYISTSWEATEVFAKLTRPVTFFGHTHMQGGFFRSGDGPVQAIPNPVGDMETRKIVDEKEGVLYYINPGSVGQPRDSDNRAAFVIYDTTGFIEYARVPYDIETTMAKMRKAALPDFLIKRLKVGR